MENTAHFLNTLVKNSSHLPCSLLLVRTSHVTPPGCQNRLEDVAPGRAAVPCRPFYLLEGGAAFWRTASRGCVIHTCLIH